MALPISVGTERMLVDFVGLKPDPQGTRRRRAEVRPQPRALLWVGLQADGVTHAKVSIVEGAHCVGQVYALGV